MSEKLYTHAQFSWGNLKEREHLDDGGVDKKNDTKMHLNNIQ